jgi:Putative beta-barrel porin-2, OmpL-like. bbp2
LSISLSVNDGFYSKKYNWLSGTIGYALTSKDSITLGAAANLGHTNKSSFTTPITLNNGQLYFLSWTHTDGPWTIQPYVQLEHVTSNSAVNILQGASTYGAAVLGKYSFNEQVALAGRAEWIKSNGTLSDGAPSLLYGPGSGAWSLTLTPTWQKGVFFARAEGSYLHVYKTSPGFALGEDLNKKSQIRGLIEAGIIF